MQTFIEFLEAKCIEETGCIKDNFEEFRARFFESVLSDDNTLNALTNEWKRQELEKWVELADVAIKELQKIKNLLKQK